MKTLIKTFAKKSGKPEEEVKSALEKARSTVAKDNPDIDTGSKKFYILLIGELKSMLSIKTEDDGADLGGIKYSDVSPGTTAGLTTYHKQKRKLKKTVTEAIDRLSGLSKEELKALGVLQDQSSELSVSMIENSICIDQLKESLSHIILGEKNDTNESDSLLYLDSAIKEAIADKQSFANFVEDIAAHLTGGVNLNETGFEYPGYDIRFGDNYLSVKTSSTKNSVNEAYRNSNSIKTSALILSSLYRMDKDLFRENCSFADISDLLEFKEQLLEFVTEKDSRIGFLISYISKDNEFRMHFTEEVEERKVLERCFDIIESSTGKTRSKFCASYRKLCDFCGGDTTTTIKLMDDNEYATLRENIISTISNIKDYQLMKKIELLLK